MNDKLANAETILFENLIKNKVSCVYCIYNKMSDKVYIGSTISLNKRIKHHFWMLKKGIHDNDHLQNAYNLYEKSNLDVYILEKTSVPDLLEKERYWIEHFNASDRSKGYNLQIDPLRPEIMSEETKKKMSIIMSGENNPMYGKRSSEETRKKISTSLKGNQYAKGHSHSEDTKKKMSIASTGRPHPCSEEQREKIRLSHLRKKASEETKLKISQSCLSIEKREHTCEICEAVFLSRHRGIVKYCSKKCKAKRFKQTHPDYEKQRYAIRLLRKL